jgi:hypothetical protein
LRGRTVYRSTSDPKAIAEPGIRGIARVGNGVRAQSDPRVLQDADNQFHRLSNRRLGIALCGPRGECGGAE